MKGTHALVAPQAVTHMDEGAHKSTHDTLETYAGTTVSWTPRNMKPQGHTWRHKDTHVHQHVPLWGYTEWT